MKWLKRIAIGLIAIVVLLGAAAWLWLPPVNIPFEGMLANRGAVALFGSDGGCGNGQVAADACRPVTASGCLRATFPMRGCCA